MHAMHTRLRCMVAKKKTREGEVQFRIYVRLRCRLIFFSCEDIESSSDGWECLLKAYTAFPPNTIFFFCSLHLKRDKQHKCG